MNMHHLPRTALAMALGLVLAACGGGDSDSAPPLPATPTTPTTPPVTPPVTPPTPVTPTTPPVTPPPAASTGLQAACSGAFCGAASNSSYSGAGVGVWNYSNTSAQTVRLPVSLSQLGQRSLTLVYSNPNAPGVQMPTPTLTLTPKAGTSTRQALQGDDAQEHGNQIPAAVRDFRPAEHLRTGAAAVQAAQTPRAAAARGSERSWFISLDEGMQARAATLQRQATFADGRVINLWLENTETGSSKVTDAILDTLLDRFARPQYSVYGMVTGLAGQPWGTYGNYTDLIASSQPIDIVLVNFIPDGKPYGLMGYFHSLNNFKKNPAHDQLKYSNESLSFYIDTETLYLDKTKGMDAQVGTLAHEFIHMINFYQRSVLKSPRYAFDTFLDEMSAVMIEDILSEKLTPGSNSARDGLVPRWLNRSTFNCDPTNWGIGDTCFGYNVVGAYGAYLLRQYGVGFYQQLLKDTSSSDSWTVLDHAITQAGGPGLAGTLPRWGSSIALLPAAASPQGFGYPQRQDASGYTLVGIDGPALAAARQLPTQVPSTLVGHGHFPFTRQSDAQGNYQEQLDVPPGITLTVVVQ